MRIVGKYNKLRTCYEYVFIPYLFSIFSYLFLYLCYYLLFHAYAICYYLILCASFSFHISDQTLSVHYLFITFLQPFLRFDQIYHSYYFQSLLVISSFHYILSPSFSHYHLTLSDSKSYASLSSYRYYLCSARSQYSSISRRPTYIMSLSFNLI